MHIFDFLFYIQIKFLYFTPFVIRNLFFPFAKVLALKKYIARVLFSKSVLKISAARRRRRDGQVLPSARFDSLIVLNLYLAST